MTEPTEAMLPCPFCGEAPKLDNIGSGHCVRIYCVGENCAAYPYIQKLRLSLNLCYTDDCD